MTTRRSPLAALDLGAHGGGEPVPHRRRLSRARRLARLEPGLRVVDRGPGELAAPPRGRTAGGPRGAIAARRSRRRPRSSSSNDVLDERRRRGRRSPAITEPGEHLLAELVGGRDRGGVEVGEGPGEPARGGARRPRVAGREEGVAPRRPPRGRRPDRRARLLGSRRVVAHPLAQLRRWPRG